MEDSEAKRSSGSEATYYGRALDDDDAISGVDDDDADGWIHIASIKDHGLGEMTMIVIPTFEFSGRVLEDRSLEEEETMNSSRMVKVQHCCCQLVRRSLL